MQILTNDGEIFTGTPSEIITAMRENARLDIAQSNAEFMADVAARVHLWNGELVRTVTPERFLTSLAEADMICVLED